MMDQFALVIPRHEVERHWHRKHPDETEMVAPNRKLQEILQQELYRYCLEVFGTERARGKAWTRETRIRAIGRSCMVCGETFVGVRAARTCSPACGSRLRGVIRPDESEQPHRELNMTSRHPEIAAIETIFEVLRQLPPPARQRVMTYALQLVESETPLRLLEAAD